MLACTLADENCNNCFLKIWNYAKEGQEIGLQIDSLQFKSCVMS